MTPHNITMVFTTTSVLNATARELAKKSNRDDDFHHFSVNTHIDRLKELNPNLHLLQNDRFLDAEKSSPSPEPSPLNGVPFVACADLAAPESIANLTDAGAVLLGETNRGVDPLSLDTRHVKRTPNPWNNLWVAGGACGVAAATVSAGGAAFGLCEDECGNLILSANFCGTVALRPSPALSDIGWHARSVGDVSQILECVIGANRLSFHQELKVWMLQDYYPFALDKSVRRTLHKARAAIAPTVDIQTLTLPLLSEAYALWVSSWEPRGGYKPEYDSGKMAIQFRNALKESQNGSGKLFQHAGTKITHALNELLGFTGVLLTPAFTSTAPSVKENGRSPMDFILTALFMALDLPALHVPLGLDEDGAPIGVQLIGGSFSEPALFEIGSMIERQYQGWKRADPRQPNTIAG